MNKNSKQLTNSFSTGGGGGHFEAHVQASFVTLMLTGGFTPCLPCWPIREIKLQGKIDGFDTDDLIVLVEEPGNEQKRKLLGQIKHTIRITQGDPTFGEVMQAAWNDFNNPALFSKNKDVIALITGPLSATDTTDVRWLLDQARHTKNEDEFFRFVEQSYFSSKQKQKKLAAFRAQLKKANNDNEVSKGDLYLFLNHFHLLGYDLGNEVGVVLSLLHSHISQFNIDYPSWAWGRIVDIVQTWNQDAGTITPEKIPEDLRETFKQRVYEVIPYEFSAVQLPSDKPAWNQYGYASDLVIANLLGSWNEKNDADLEVVYQLANEDFGHWIVKIREILQEPESPIALKNGRWRVTERETLWQALGARLFDDNLDRFGQCAVSVLTECDPQFDLPIEERYLASIHGKVLKHSPELRQGLAESLALLGNKPDDLTNCS
ncbi:MAG: hypothetical protein GQ533_07395, partial [Methanosarcinaceae archaeon]|nr:hypothetical protein [Methanosarcinaceae archaeon]